MRGLLVLVGALSVACTEPPAGLEWSAAEREQIASLSPLPPPPPDETNAHADSATAAALGRRLFFDAGLSRDGAFACATCHDPARGLADGLPTPAGRGPLPRHAPSLWNVASQRWYFWDGRADTLWGQAAGPIENPLEMDSSRLFVVRHVAREPELRALYEAEFGALPPVLEPRFPEHARPGEGDEPERRAWRELAEADREAIDGAFANVLKCLAAFERSLASAESPFDRFARGLASGDREALGALSRAERRGLRVFLGPGRCTLCHFGPLLSDREFHDTRVPPRGGGHARDPGRLEGIARLRAEPDFASFGPHSDEPAGQRARLSRALLAEGSAWGEFKTPSLREVALSPPYMHEGQFPDLESVVAYYSSLEGALPLGHHQETLLRPAALDAGQQADLVAFLRSLTSRAVLPPELR